MDGKKHRILFVCMGNICRSPAAEEIFRDTVKKKGKAEEFEIDSAGTYGGHAGEMPDSRMREAAFERGYRLTHRSRQFRREDFGLFDMIIVMDDHNYEMVSRLAPDEEGLGKIHRMTDFCTAFDADEVPDPYYDGRRGFEKVLDMLEDACSNLFDNLVKQPVKKS